MRLLSQSRVLWRAGLAALVTSLACYPRLAEWTERTGSLEYFWLVLLWAAFVLWAFVFAWQAEYAARPVMGDCFRPRLWGWATLCCVIWAIELHFLVDPQLHRATPREFPVNWASWAAMTLFTVAFDPLFLCFAPFAFFIRLTRRQPAATALTVLFGVFVLYLRLSAFKNTPPFGLVVELMLTRVVGGFLTIYFYLKGGAPLVWWMAFCLQLRHLPGLVYMVKPANRWCLTMQMSLPGTRNRAE